MPNAIESQATARLIEGYLVEHLFDTAPAAEVAAPGVTAYQPLRVGPFRFLCRADELSLVAPMTPAGVVIDAGKLVPAAYQSRLSGATPGPASVWLEQGCIELRGCSLEPVLALAPGAVALRDARGDNPWIAGSVREPPAFMLEPAALQDALANH